MEENIEEERYSKGMQNIKGYDTFVKIDPINKGWSSDKKIYIETTEGRKLLLRISDICEYDI
jgi:aminoglycoside phosphotransferase (APT) family kinase protein